MKWIITTENDNWRIKPLELKEAGYPSEDKLVLTGKTGQIMKGFGGCFNELGYIALNKIDKNKKQLILKDLFTEEGCNLGFCRVPIGASDYAAEWYSHNEWDNDYNMEHYSIERDYKYLIPYIKDAMEYKSNMTLFASPWSPPTWMKYPKAYNYGTLRMEPEVLNAYAIYFKKFIESYKREGIEIEQIHIQNEPFADQKFPSCVWNEEQFRVFIGKYLGPLFKREGIKSQIWLGTLNGPKEEEYDRYINHILLDKDVRGYISGIGYQWAGKHVIAKTKESWPELSLMQTENECGDGKNSWEYAEYIFGLARHYFKNGVNAYTYWNMVLEPGGISTWGWNQNAMITIDPTTETVTYNPEYYIMKHYSHAVQPGAVYLETSGHWSSLASVFRNPDGSLIIVVQNALDHDQEFAFEGEGKSFSVTLEKHSVHTFVL